MESTDKKLIEVTVSYYGHFRKLTGKTTEELHIRPSFKEGMIDLKKHLIDKHDISQGYYAMLNNVDIVRYFKAGKGPDFSKKDQIKIIPIISGG